MLAKGGGHATAAGMNFEAFVGAFYFAEMLSELRIDPKRGLDAVPRSIRFETEAPVDDILVKTTANGYVFIQAKTNLRLSSSPESEFARVADQLVRQWLACDQGSGERGWDRPFQNDLDRILIAVGPQTPESVKVDLSTALETRRLSPDAPLNQKQTRALEHLTGQLSVAWKRSTGAEADAGSIDRLLRIISVISFDPEGADRIGAITALKTRLPASDSAEGALIALERISLGLTQRRAGLDAQGLRTALSTAGVVLTASPSYVDDVNALRAYTARTRSQLSAYEEISIDGSASRIERDCTVAVVEAAARESFLLVGEPGAGKSAVLNSAATELAASGHEVIQLAVDRLPVQSQEGLKDQLGLQHPLRDVLANWPGNDAIILFIDALDATRGGPSEAVFRALIKDALELGQERCRVVASIRSFDLKLGVQYRDLFKGQPPSERFVDGGISNVRHLLVPSWSSDELRHLLAVQPKLAIAIERGGSRLRDLALVPFNTRLLADLLDAGVTPDAFGNVGSQVELLDAYWQWRVARHGTGAALVLRQVVAAMVQNKQLRADRIASNIVPADALDLLMRDNVLVSVDSDRFIGFRHHILFDYSASRVYLNPGDVAETVSIARADRGLGFMLAPALNFALQEQWATDKTKRSQFWRAVFALAGNLDVDPIARSVAARVASELPKCGEDVSALIEKLVEQAPPAAPAISTISQIVGSLAVRADDKLPLEIEPWAHLVEGISGRSDDYPWAMRTLLFLLIGRSSNAQHRTKLGIAARALLSTALSGTYGPEMAVIATGFVADTYSTDPVASKLLLRKLMSPERFELNGHSDLPWLARSLGSISESDAEFAAEIMQFIFSHEISDEGATPIGRSRILPLTSNRRQDYDMARFQVKEFFPRFIEKHPLMALRVLTTAFEKEAREDRDAQKTWTLTGGGLQATLIADGSYVWAWNPSERHANNRAGLLMTLVSYLERATPQETVELAINIITQGRLAVLWSRLLIVAARKPDVLGSLLWDFVIQEPLLVCTDTRKYAIDFIAARYLSEPPSDRERFEKSLANFDYSDFTNPEGMRQHLTETIFGTIGSSALVTEAAKTIADTVLAERPKERINRRPFEITSGYSEPEKWWWLTEAGVDVNAAGNRELLEEVDRVKTVLGLEGRPAKGASLSETLELVDQLVARTETSSAVPLVVTYADGVIAQGIARGAMTDVRVLRQSPDIVRRLADLAMRYSTNPEPQVTPNIEDKFEENASWGSPAPRIDAAEAAIILCQVDAATVTSLRRTVENALMDPHPAVRLVVEQRLSLLWTTDRELMWQLATKVANDEQNRGVLRFFLEFLSSVLHADPEYTERLLTIVRERALRGGGGRLSNDLFDAFGSLTTLLWVSHERRLSRQVLDTWLADMPSHEDELNHGLVSVRTGLVLGYSDGTENDINIRRRCQAFVEEIVDVCADKLELYFKSLGKPEQTDSTDHITVYAKLLNNACDQLYFAAGAFQGSPANQVGLLTLPQKKAFLIDVQSSLRRIGDVGTPATIFHLVGLLDHLLPADPELGFDLVAHALLTAGKQQGYQFESLGADTFASIVGRLLADHRRLFEDEHRRTLLVACLDVFIEVGWPSARRILYSLPELLQ
jgi:hypothetical protein